MALTWTEMEAITRDYFAMDGGKAQDIYYKTSFFLNWFLDQKKGLYMLVPGGLKIRVPLAYDTGIAEFYDKGDTVNSDDREQLNAAYFNWKHLYGNATIYRIDTLEQAGEYGEVQLIEQRLDGGQKGLTYLMAGSVYDAPGGGSSRFDGMLALCNETASLAYGGIAEDDLVSDDGTKPWEGKLTSTTEKITLNVIRTMASTAKTMDGQGGKPDFVTMTETLFNIVADILQAQQRFTEGKETAKAGFTGLYFEGKELYADDFCPSGYAFAWNSKHLGFAIHPQGNFSRTKWAVIPDSPEDKTLKIYFDGNIITNNRKAHIGHSNLS